jgi:hypothetical protein
MAKPDLSRLSAKLRQQQAGQPKPATVQNILTPDQMRARKAVETRKANQQAASGQPVSQPGQPTAAETWLAVTEETDRLVCQPVSAGNSADWQVSAAMADGLLTVGMLTVNLSDATAETAMATAREVGRLQDGLTADRTLSEDASWPRAVSCLAGLCNASRIILQSHDGNEREIGRGQSYMELLRMTDAFVTRQTTPTTEQAA